MSDENTAPPDPAAERAARFPDLCNKLTAGAFGATTFCAQPKGHRGGCDWRTAPPDTSPFPAGATADALAGLDNGRRYWLPWVGTNAGTGHARELWRGDREYSSSAEAVAAAQAELERRAQLTVPAQPPGERAVLDAEAAEQERYAAQLPPGHAFPAVHAPAGAPQDHDHWHTHPGERAPHSHRHTHHREGFTGASHRHRHENLPPGEEITELDPAQVTLTPGATETTQDYSGALWQGTDTGQRPWAVCEHNHRWAAAAARCATGALEVMARPPGTGAALPPGWELLDPPRVVPVVSTACEPPFHALVSANLASLNEILAEVVAALGMDGIADEDFAELAVSTLRRHTWTLGHQFQGARAPAGFDAATFLAEGITPDEH